MEMKVFFWVNLWRENHNCSGWSACVCVSFINLTQKQITGETSNLVFHICIICRYYLKIFYEDRTNSVYSDTQKNFVLQPMVEISY